LLADQRNNLVCGCSAEYRKSLRTTRKTQVIPGVLPVNCRAQPHVERAHLLARTLDCSAKLVGLEWRARFQGDDRALLRERDANGGDAFQAS